MTHGELKTLALKDAEVRQKYDALEPEFMLLRNMLKARIRLKRAKSTQK